MRCSCCNVILTPQESTRKFKTSGDYVDMCNRCLDTISDDVDYTDGYQGDDEFYDSDGESEE